MCIRDSAEATDFVRDPHGLPNTTEARVVHGLQLDGGPVAPVAIAGPAVVVPAMNGMRHPDVAVLHRTPFHGQTSRGIAKRITARTPVERRERVVTTLGRDGSADAATVVVHVDSQATDAIAIHHEFRLHHEESVAHGRVRVDVVDRIMANAKLGARQLDDRHVADRSGEEGITIGSVSYTHLSQIETDDATHE